MTKSNLCPQCGGMLIPLVRLAVSERNLWCDSCNASHAVSPSTAEETWVLARTDGPDYLKSWSWEGGPASSQPEVVWTRSVDEAAKLSSLRAFAIHDALWHAGVPLEKIRLAELKAT